MWQVVVKNTYPRVTLVFSNFQTACDIAKTIIIHSVDEVSAEISYKAAGERDDV